MENRDKFLINIRPIITNAKVNDSTNPEEAFQNITLRPLIKLQNDLLLAVFKNYIRKHKNVYHNLTIEKRLEYIDNAIQKDIKFRNSIKGIIIGVFTIKEYDIYTQNSSALNKRMMNIVRERLKNSLLCFDIV